MAYTRIERLQNAMANSGFDGALIVSPEDRLYFTQFPSSDGYLLVSAEKAVFVTDSRYVEAAEKKAVGCSVVLQTTDSTQLFELFSEMHVTRVAVEASRMNLAQYARICNALEPMAVLADSTLDNLIAGLRSVKQPDEIEKSARRKRSPNKLSRIFVSLSNPAKPSVKCHWNWISLCRHGAEALSFETIAVSGENGSMPHGVPGSRKIQAGDFVTMDFGAVVDGYHSDMTRTVAVGQVSDRQKKFTMWFCPHKSAPFCAAPRASLFGG